MNLDAPRLEARGRETPVFHDASGRRARIVRILGAALAAFAAGSVALVVTGAIGFTTVPRLGIAATVAHVSPARPVRTTSAEYREVRSPRDPDLRADVQ